MELKRIVITGTGVIPRWQHNCICKPSRRQKVALAKSPALTQKVIAVLSQAKSCWLRPARTWSPQQPRKSIVCQFAIAASNEAVEEAGLKDSLFQLNASAFLSVRELADLLPSKKK